MAGGFRRSVPLSVLDWGTVARFLTLAPTQEDLIWSLTVLPLSQCSTGPALPVMANHW